MLAYTVVYCNCEYTHCCCCCCWCWCSLTRDAKNVCMPRWRLHFVTTAKSYTDEQMKQLVHAVSGDTNGRFII